MRIVITKELLENAKTDTGGFTRAQMDVFDIPWPPPKGWPRSLIGREVDAEQYHRFVAAKDIMAKQRANAFNQGTLF